MSFAKTRSIVQEGDTVIIYVNPQAMYALQVKPLTATKKGDMVENIFQTAYGALKVQELVGKKFGHKVQFSRGWGYLLHPTPELWTLNLKHRTQILYTRDISLIVMQLDLKAGSIVVESGIMQLMFNVHFKLLLFDTFILGTGSGSLSHAILRAIAPTGHLYTFDFHQQRVEIVTQEFSDHGLEEFVTAKQRDACKDGFDLEDAADAVFLDLPNPWLAIPHAVKSLKKSGKFFFCLLILGCLCIVLCKITFYNCQGEEYVLSLHVLSKLKRHVRVCWLKDSNTLRQWNVFRENIK